MVALIRSVFVVIALAGCIGTGSELCADGRICPEGLSCDEIHAGCTTPEQVAVCQGVADGEPCSANSAQGFCDAQICLTSECGDGQVGPGELCDDGNTESGDGCRADCMSELRCGDGVIEPDLGEECDCGDATLGAGCMQLNSDVAGAECKADCTAHCGDGVTNSAEQCDPNDLFNNSCLSLGRGRGTLGCASTCSFFLEPCGSVGEELEPLFVNLTVGEISISGEFAYMAATGGFLEPPSIWRGVGDGWVPEPVPNVAGVVQGLHTNADGSAFLAFAPFEQSPLSLVIDVVAKRKDVWGASPGNKNGNFNDVSEAHQVWGRSETDVYIVGSNGAANPGEEGVVLHFDGMNWTRDNMRDLRAITGNDDIVMVAGIDGFACNDDGTWRESKNSGTTITALTESEGVFYGGTSEGEIVVLDCINLSLTPHASPTILPGESIAKLESPRPGILVASGTTNAYFFDGRRWSQLETEITHPVARALGARPTGPDAEGRYEFFLGGKADGAAGVSRFSDSFWTTAVDHGLTRADDIWVADDDVVFVVGNGAVRSLAPNGVARNFAPSLSADLLRVRGRNSSDVFAAGKLGAVYHFDGTAWTDLNPLLPSGTTTAFRGIHVTEDNAFFGGVGVVLRYDGSAFEPLLFPSTRVVRGLGGRAGDLYALTTDALWHHDGSTWTQLVDPAETILELLVTSDGTVWIGSINGALYNWTNGELIPAGTVLGRVNSFSELSADDIAMVSGGIPLNHNNGLGFSPVTSLLSETPTRISATARGLYVLSENEVRILHRQGSWAASPLP